MNEPPRYLWLFDIDGTLILGRGAGEKALREAMRRAFGQAEGFAHIVMAGATDKKIVQELLQANGLACTEENVAAVLERYLEVLPDFLPAHGGELSPGILGLLEALASRPDCAMGLLTGNLRRGAELKLRHFGVWHFFPFGAFADDHPERNQLGPFARQRALEYHGEEFPPERIFILGDTPKDIACGRALGAKTVAIATGPYSEAELAAHGPDFLFSDLADTQKVLATLLPQAKPDTAE